MKNTFERTGLILAIIAIVTFWVPPLGLFLGIAAMVVTLQKFEEKRRFSRLALSLSIVAIVMFVALWSTIWVLSQ
jgi:succinate dehydrogenase/fumarate reductase cytochrome b subunit